MLKRLADKAGKEMAATDQDGAQKYFKLLNSTYLGIRKLHTDVQGVATPDSGIEPGTILTVANGPILTVSVITFDYYKGRLIRLWLDLVDSNNTVTVTRPTAINNGQGGVTGFSEAELYQNVPVKIGTVLQKIERELDTTYSQFGMLLSTKFPIQQGDRLAFGSHYAEAKVEGIKLNYEGVFEISFDKDPRWI